MVGDILQPTHLLLILVVALLVLGPKRLPEVGRTLGSGLRDFRDAISGESSDSHYEPRPEPETVYAPPEEHYQPPVEQEPTSATEPATTTEPDLFPTHPEPLASAEPEPEPVIHLETNPVAETPAEQPPDLLIGLSHETEAEPK